MLDIHQLMVGEDGENNDTFDDIPGVELGDETKDVHALFRMMYKTPPEDAPLDLMESVLRVANKYGVEQYQA
ncbi:hypothetical protein FRB95_002531 [Tulasnella sp. JGI-2019a]|nr:hypothetical protein FRB95_002531 [Tulasnella sp. JGI-2019a]